MGYRELALPTPRPALVVDGATYDIDYFGMDDGRSEAPDAAFRFLFQLGSGYMIYLYVIQAGGRDDPGHFFHTFWQKDCAVAEVEMEEWGPPSEVCALSTPLPLVYEALELRSGAGEHVTSRRLAIVSQRFRARHAKNDGDELAMDFELSEADGAQSRLSWSKSEAWQVELRGGPRRKLARHERLLFGAP